MSEIKVNKLTPRTNCGTTTLGDSGDTFNIPAGVTISNSGTATGFGATGAVNWDVASIKTVDFTAVSGVGYFVDTATTGAVEVTLPAAPAVGDVVGVSDYANNFATANCTLNRNSLKVGGTAINPILQTSGVAVTLVYVDVTKGWIVTDSGNQSDAPTAVYLTATGGCITTCGNYKIHTFLSPGTFEVTSVGNPSGSDTVDYLVLAGGGGGGSDYGGGGGAGGYRESVPSPAAWTGSPIAFANNARPVSATPYAITVGGGGAGGTGGCTQGTDGNLSTFSDITSAGGGGGGTEGGHSGRDGGSGGGTSYYNTPVTVGAGDVPNVTPDQGFPGGFGWNAGTGGHATGGGGGAGAVGTAAPSAPVAGPGGTGVTSSITGAGITRGGGGGGAGGGGGPQPYTKGCGGAGGGGAGATSGMTSNGVAGGCNTGGGGGGGNNPTQVGGNGGSGIVVLRYKYQ